MPRPAHHPRIEELEPRLLYSADLAPVAFDASQPVAAEVRLLDSGGEYAQTQQTARHELVIIDPRVDDYTGLLAEWLGQAADNRHIDVLVLDPARDGLAQISEALAARDDLDALHLIAHGEAGRLQLGDGWLDTTTLGTRADELLRWQDALTADADLLIYGCDVGAGSVGASFVHTLSTLTGADVAASDDRTGHATQGGDWVLETRVGSVEAVSLSSAHWAGVLDLTAAPAQQAVNTTTAESQTATAGRAVAINPVDGSSVVVWMSHNQDGDAGGIYLQRFDANGDPLGGEVQVNTITTGEQTAPALAMNDNGTFVVVWQSENVDGNGWGIVAQRFDASGNALGGEIIVNDTTINDQTMPDVGIDMAGNFVVVWADHALDGSGDGIYARRFLADGSPASGEFHVADTSTNDQFEPAVAMNAGGEFVIAWTSENQDYSLLGGYSDGVYARRYDALGAALGGEFRAPTVSLADILFTNNSQHRPDVAIDNLGNFIITLVDEQDGTIKANAYDSAGNHVGSVQANATTGTVLRDATVAFDGNGGFVVAWTEDNADGSGDAIMARHFRSDLTAYAGAQVINSVTAGNQTGASLAVQNGRVLVVWSGHGASDGLGVSLRSAALADAANTAPVITSPAAINVPENTTTVALVTASDANTPSQLLSYKLVGGADQLRFEINLLTGALSFKLAPDYEAPTDANMDNIYDVAVQVFDGALTDTQTLTITVQPANEHAPVITSHGGSTVDVSILENTSAVATLTASDADLPAQTLTWSFAGGADAGRFTIDAASGELNFVAPPDHDIPGDFGGNNVYEVVVQVSDGSLTDARTFRVTVQDVNEAPTASNGGYGSLEDQALAGTLPLANDPEGQLITYSLLAGTPNATVVVNPDGSFSYTPNADYNGLDSFQFRVSDALGLFSDYTAYVDVGPVNDAPTLASGDTSVVQGQSVKLTSANLQAADIDDALGTLRYELLAPPAGGTLVLNGTALGVGDAFTQADVDAGHVQYVHAGGAPIADQFQLKLADPGGAMVLTTLRVAVAPDPNVIAPPATPPAVPEAPEAPAPATPNPDTPPDAPPVIDDSAAAAAPLAPAPMAGGGFGTLLDAPTVIRIDLTPVLAPPAYGGGPATSPATASQPILAALEQTFQAVAHDLRALESMRLSFGSGDFQQQLDQLRDEIGQLNLDKNTVAASLALSTGLSVGYVLWLIRGGVLLSSLLSSLPAWRLIDPLPVLGHLHRRDDSDDESLEDMLEQPTPPPPPDPTDARAP